MDLPEPRLEKLPSFKQLKSGTPKYGSGRDFLNTEEEMHGIAHKNFRKGKVGSWREEFPETLLPLFWMIHQEEMERWGYTNMEEKTQVREKPIKAIVDAQKLLDPSRDGIRRYVEELILNLWVLESKTGAYWQIDLLIGNDLTFSLKEYVRQNHSLEKVLTLNNEELEALNKELEVLYTYESRLMRIKGMLKERLPRNLYLMLRKAYINLPFRIILSYFRKRKTETIISKETEPPIYDIIHIPLPQRVPEVSIQARKHVTTLHDLTHKLFPQFHEKSNSIKAESGLKDAIKKKSEFICISQATQEDLLTYYPVESNRTHVIYESASRSHFFPRKDDNNWQKILEKYGLADEKFFFCLFTLEPRKNVRGTIEAFRLFKKAHPSEPILLWIGGKTGWKMEGLFEKDALKEEGIFFPGFIDEADLPYFYSKMEALCYISHYEGFGLPPFEAMSCGAPVIYGNNSSMRELIGTAGLPADAGDVEEIKSQMETILFDSELKEELALRSLQQTARFSWLKMAWETLQVYEKTLISGGKT
jgi:glycosyltransferase involved in cell wall biosynthesis